MQESMHQTITISAPLGALPRAAVLALVLVVVCLPPHASAHGSSPAAVRAQIGTSVHTLNGVVTVTLANATIGS